MIKFQIGNKEGTNLKDLNMGSIHNLDETATPRAKGGWSHPDETYERPGYARFSHDFTIGTNIFDLGIFTAAGTTGYIWQNGKRTGMELVLQNVKTDKDDIDTHVFVLRNTKFNQGIVMSTSKTSGLYLMLNSAYEKVLGSNPSWKQCVTYGTTICGGCNEEVLGTVDNCFFCGWKKCTGYNKLADNERDSGYTNDDYLMTAPATNQGLNRWNADKGRLRCSFLNLENPYLWYQFITGELYIKTASTIDLFNEDEDPIIMAQNAYGDYWIAGQFSINGNEYDTSMFAFYQLGTDLSQYLRNVGDKITLFNGSIIERITYKGSNDFIRFRDASGTYKMLTQIAPYDGICLKKLGFEDPRIKYESSYTGIYLTKTPGTSGGLKNWINTRDDDADFITWLTASCLICETTYNAANGGFYWPKYNDEHSKYPNQTYKQFFTGHRMMFGTFMIHNGRQVNDRIAYDYDFRNSAENTMTTAGAWRVLLGISQYIDKTNPTGNPDAIGGGASGGGGSNGSGKGNFNSINDSIGSGIPLIGSESVGQLFQMATISDTALNQLGLLMDHDTRNNIIDSIVSLKLLYLPMPVDVKEAKQLKLGGSNQANVFVNPVRNQYQELDCGTINVQEYYGSFLDYDPYTKIKIYLPFSGYYDLNTDSIMNGSIGLKLNVDILSGTCMWIISVTNVTGTSSVLYQFPGNIAGEIPITSTDYSGRISTAVNALTRITGDLISQNYIGAATEAISGGVELALSKPTKSNGGGMNGAIGAMSATVPYLIIERPIANIPENYAETVGYRSDASLLLGEATGYMKIRDVHLENMGYATADEIAEIESLLKEGVIF